MGLGLGIEQGGEHEQEAVDEWVFVIAPFTFHQLSPTNCQRFPFLMQAVHNRDSIDGRGMVVRSKVHYKKAYDNAFCEHP